MTKEGNKCYDVVSEHYFVLCLSLSLRFTGKPLTAQTTPAARRHTHYTVLKLFDAFLYDARRGFQWFQSWFKPRNEHDFKWFINSFKTKIFQLPLMLQISYIIHVFTFFLIFFFLICFVLEKVFIINHICIFWETKFKNRRLYLPWHSLSGSSVSFPMRGT